MEREDEKDGCVNSGLYSIVNCQLSIVVVFRILWEHVVVSLTHMIPSRGPKDPTQRSYRTTYDTTYRKLRYRTTTRL